MDNAAGAYVARGPSWLHAALPSLDWCWFLVVFGWALVLLLWWARSRRHVPPAWQWVPWAAATALLSAFIVFTDLTVARLGASPREAYFKSDHALSIVIAALAAGWWWQSGRVVAAPRRWFAWMMLTTPVAVCGWILSFGPTAGQRQFAPTSNALCAVVALAALPWCCQRGATAWSRCGVILVAAGPVVSTVGPLASYVFFMRERFSPLTPLCLVWAALQLVAAVVSLFGLLRLEWSRRGPVAQRELWLDAKPYLVAALVWFGLGCTAAFVVGRRERRHADEHALDLARLAATQVDRTALAQLVAPAFRLEAITSAGGPTKLGVSRYLARGAETAAHRTLRPIAEGSRTLSHLRFVSFRDGWMVGMAGYVAPMLGSAAHIFASISVDPKFASRHAASGHVLLTRRVTASDLCAWSDRREWVEGPISSRIFTSPVVMVRQPITAGGRMLGWLEFTYQAEAYLAETVQSRVAPFLGTVLGVLLVSALFLHRRETRARDEARVERESALAAQEAKHAFFAKVSHELRTPLQSIIGYGQLLEQDVATAEGRSRLTAQRRHAELMLRLVNDLLDINATESGAFRLVERPIALGPFLQQTVDSLRPQAADKGLTLTFTQHRELPSAVSVDPERLRQILLNLLGNAIKFTDQGKVEVSAGVTSAEGALVHLEIVVRDTGPGIPGAEQERVFQPFARLDAGAAKPGTGLGLAVVAALCRSAGGSIHLESDGRTGCTFSVRLPVVLADQRALAPSPTSAASLHGRRILIADDNELVRELFSLFLAQQGAVCDVVEDGEAALARALAQDYDALILDLAMPRVDGAEVARRLRKHGVKVRIVGASAHASAADRQRALDAGMNDFLVKPIDLPELAAALAADFAPITAARKAEIQGSLARLFRADVARHRADLTDALKRGDWDALRRLAHYLKNSAGVVRAEKLHTACTALEIAAESREPHLIREAVQACDEALVDWRQA